jgi:hypothetical protein
MCAILLVLAAIYLLALVVISLVVLGTGAVTGGVLGAVVGAARGQEGATGCERRLRAYHGASAGGCLGAVVGLVVAGLLLGVGAVILCQ